MTFEGETLSIGGMELTGTVIVEPRVTDGSFDHAFGTERVIDLEFLSGGFVPDLDINVNEALACRAVYDWIYANDGRVWAAYERHVKD